jgi:Holliday junction resolvase RusA-like endonuclease
VRLAFTIPGPPVGKERARSGKGGKHHYTPDRTRAYEATVKNLAYVALMKSGLRGRWPLDAEYRLELEVHFDDRRRRDGSNVLKAVEDGMNGTVYVDDSQIAECTWRRVQGSPRPRVEVVVEVLGGSSS